MDAGVTARNPQHPQPLKALRQLGAEALHREPLAALHGAGEGGEGRLGAHIVDLARYLCGEIAAVSATVRSYVAGHQVDDAFVATVEFANGAIGTLEATRLALGRVNQNSFEVNGSRGSLAFDLERFDELLVSNGGPYCAERVTGDWWPPGHGVGWGDTFTLEVLTLLEAIAGRGSVAPHGATFEDGYRANAIVEAIVDSARKGSVWTKVEY